MSEENLRKANAELEARVIRTREEYKERMCDLFRSLEKALGYEDGKEWGENQWHEAINEVRQMRAQVKVIEADLEDQPLTAKELDEQRLIFFRSIAGLDSNSRWPEVYAEIDRRLKGSQGDAPAGPGGTKFRVGDEVIINAGAAAAMRYWQDFNPRAGLPVGPWRVRAIRHPNEASAVRYELVKYGYGLRHKGYLGYGNGVVSVAASDFEPHALLVKCKNDVAGAPKEPAVSDYVGELAQVLDVPVCQWELLLSDVQSLRNRAEDAFEEVEELRAFRDSTLNALRVDGGDARAVANAIASLRHEVAEGRGMAGTIDRLRDELEAAKNEVVEQEVSKVEARSYSRILKDRADQQEQTLRTLEEHRLKLSEIVADCKSLTWPHIINAAREMKLRAGSGGAVISGEPESLRETHGKLMEELRERFGFSVLADSGEVVRAIDSVLNTTRDMTSRAMQQRDKADERMVRWKLVAKATFNAIQRSNRVISENLPPDMIGAFSDGVDTLGSLEHLFGLDKERGDES